jgi:hypothetical protein
MNWAEHPEQLARAKVREAVLEKISPGIIGRVRRELEADGPDAMASAIEKLTSLGLLVADGQTVEGVDNTPEGIEQIRQELVEHRNHALGIGEMRYSVLMSHVIALLAELKDIKEGHAALPEHIKQLTAQAKKDITEMEKD